MGAVFLLFLSGSIVAQESASTASPEKEKPLFCGGIVNGTPNPPCTTRPRVTHSEDPNHPKQRGKVHLPGTVQLALVVGTDGLPTDITVFSSLTPDFDREAIECVKKWRFSPATLDGKKVETRIHVEVTFK